MCLCVGCLPIQETPQTQVRSLGREDPLEKEMATHSSILAWRIPWTGEPGGLKCMVSQRIRHDCVTRHAHIDCRSKNHIFQTPLPTGFQA